MENNPQDILKKFKEEIASRSFAGRNLELGKMVTCWVCQNRHRSSIKCEPKYIKLAAQTRKGVSGAASVKGKRINPHPSKRKLQLLEMTRTLFPEHFKEGVEPVEAMKLARIAAARVLRKKYADKRDHAR